MTKEELLQDVANENYKVVQQHIREAMEYGKTSEEFFPEGEVDYDSEWLCRNRVINMLKNDGFTVDIDSKYQKKITVSWNDDNEQSSLTKFVW